MNDALYAKLRVKKSTTVRLQYERGSRAGENADEPREFSPGRSEREGRSSGNLIVTTSANVPACDGGLVKHTLEEEGAVETNAL